MAIDSADKRKSISEFEFLTIPPTPDGDITSVKDRSHILGLYRGFTIVYSPLPSEPGVNTENKRRSITELECFLIPPVPDLLISSSADRIHMIGFYRGLIAEQAGAIHQQVRLTSSIYNRIVLTSEIN